MNIIRNVLSKVIRFIPTSNYLTFNSFPDYTDNAYAMFRYLSINGYGNKYRLVWLLNDKSKKQQVRKRIKDEGGDAIVVNKMSLAGIWLFLRSRHCFYTHGIFEAIKIEQNNDKMIFLWHGMPLKRIGLLDNRKETFMPNLNFILATSKMYQDIMAKCFGIPKQKVLPIGQPRCDLLWEETDFYRNAGIAKEKYDKIGIWMPTYRYSIVSTEDRVDGTYKDGWISFLDENGLKKLDEQLGLINHLLLIKLHPMDKSQLYDFQKYRNIIIIKQKDFHSQLYPLLGSTDYMLTDFSGVCVDYDLLKKPMGFTIDNYDSYVKSRGFLFEDFLSVVPGIIIQNFEELIQFIKHPFYKASKLDLNTYYDNKNTERLIKFLDL